VEDNEAEHRSTIKSYFNFITSIHSDRDLLPSSHDMYWEKGSSGRKEVAFNRTISKILKIVKHSTKLFLYNQNPVQNKNLEISLTIPETRSLMC